MIDLHATFDDPRDGSRLTHMEWAYRLAGAVARRLLRNRRACCDFDDIVSAGVLHVVAKAADFRARGDSLASPALAFRKYCTRTLPLACLDEYLSILHGGLYRTGLRVQRVDSFSRTTDEDGCAVSSGDLFETDGRRSPAPEPLAALANRDPADAPPIPSPLPPDLALACAMAAPLSPMQYGTGNHGPEHLTPVERRLRDDWLFWIRVLADAGYEKSFIGRALGVTRNTVAKYLKESHAAETS